MKQFTALILSLVISTMHSQESKDYLIKLNKDTVFIKVIKIDRTMRNVICEEKGRKIKYKAKDILAVKTDTVFYESGFVRGKRIKPKHFVFLLKTVSGNLNLYEIKVSRSKFSFREAVKDVSEKGMMHPWVKRYPFTVFFYKKENEPRDRLSRYWKEKTKDCKLLGEKFNSKLTPWTPTPRELVKFYNTNCR